MIMLGMNEIIDLMNIVVIKSKKSRVYAVKLVLYQQYDETTQNK